MLNPNNEYHCLVSYCDGRTTEGPVPEQNAELLKRDGTENIKVEINDGVIRSICFRRKNGNSDYTFKA